MDDEENSTKPPRKQNYYPTQMDKESGKTNMEMNGNMITTESFVKSNKYPTNMAKDLKMSRLRYLMHQNRKSRDPLKLVNYHNPNDRFRGFEDNVLKQKHKYGDQLDQPKTTFSSNHPNNMIRKNLIRNSRKNMENTKLNSDLPNVYHFQNDILNDHNKTIVLPNINLYHNNTPSYHTDIIDVPSNHNDILNGVNENARETSEELVNDWKGLTLTSDGWMPFLNDNNKNTGTRSGHNEFALDHNGNNQDLANNEKFAEMRNDNTKSAADFKSQKLHQNYFPIHIAVGGKKICRCLAQ